MTQLLALPDELVERLQAVAASWYQDPDEREWQRIALANLEAFCDDCEENLPEQLPVVTKPPTLGRFDAMLCWRWALLDGRGNTAHELAEWMSVKGLPYATVLAQWWPEVRAFRKLNQKERIRVCARFLRRWATTHPEWKWKRD